ncbi:hypothetical protein ACFQ0T_36515 [Kitasatospora gansuensis]
MLATSTPDQPCPATAPYVAHRLGLGTVPAFDVGAVCSGFLYALATATALLHSGLCRAPLVVGADTYSSIVDPTDRDTAALFGDGAGAVLLRPGRIDAPGAVLAAALGADGSGHQLIAVPGGGSRQPMHLPQVDPKATTFRMQGREVYAHAVRRMVASAREALDRAGWPRRPWRRSSATRPTSASSTRSPSASASARSTASGTSATSGTRRQPPFRW